MLSELTPTDIAFIMAGLVQVVPAVLWWVGGRMIGDTHRATAWWSAFAASSVLSFVFLVAAMHTPEAAPSMRLRAAGNVFNVLAVVALQRGVWRFIDRAPTVAGHVLVIALMLAASWLGLDPARGALRVGVLSSLQALMALGIMRDLYRHGRDAMKLRQPWLLVLPLAVAGFTYAARGLRALLVPDSVGAEMTVNSGLNIASAFVYVLVTLSFHAMLMALVITRLVADLQRLSRHDGLTGLLNRRALEEALTAQLQRGRRAAEAFCVMMVDVDHFKRINDRHGHAVGDAALKQLAALMRRQVREVDRVGRFGGEEFLVLLPGLELPAARAVAERLRESVAATPLAHADAAITLSVSIGIAQSAGAHEDVSRLLVRADAALYQAKQGGRDQVAAAAAEPLPA